MRRKEALRWPDRAGTLRHACDLDLLLFFVRHSHTFLTSDALARFLGYDLPQIVDSIDYLGDKGLITQTQTPAHAARLYVFAADSPQPEWLQSIVQTAFTRAGRLSLIEAMRRRAERPMAKTQSTS
jgi:DNA-binding MarR family transcriptional regulator